MRRRIFEQRKLASAFLCLECLWRQRRNSFACGCRLDLHLFHAYDKNARWWGGGIGPDPNLSETFPEEKIPEGVSTRDFVKEKAQMMAHKIRVRIFFRMRPSFPFVFPFKGQPSSRVLQEEMTANPASPLWEDLKPDMTPAHQEKLKSEALLSASVSFSLSLCQGLMLLFADSDSRRCF